MMILSTMREYTRSISHEPEGSALIRTSTQFENDLERSSGSFNFSCVNSRVFDPVSNSVRGQVTPLLLTSV